MNDPTIRFKHCTKCQRRLRLRPTHWHVDQCWFCNKDALAAEEAARRALGIALELTTVGEADRSHSVV